MLEHLVEWEAGTIGLVPLKKSELDGWLDTQPEPGRAWVAAHSFTGEAGQSLSMPAPDGSIAAILVGMAEDDDPWAFAALPAKLAPGTYAILPALASKAASWAAQSWALATYAFGRYKARPARDWPRLVWPEHADRAQVSRTVKAMALVRDLINTPAADLGPAELATAAEVLAADYGARVKVVVGDGLIAENYPAIHAVGRAAAPQRQPRLVDLLWGDDSHPKLTLVGKGVCFDSGGLDIKSSGNMKLMKKDMGG
ncbi:MAG: leucyl aminopeptidase family protein, partial [Magnetospirillum sp.]